MKGLNLTIPPRLRPHLTRLVKDGLSGATERQVAIRLIEEKLREALHQTRKTAWHR
jgi:hypothetical protein